jgi:hypothetical protein
MGLWPIVRRIGRRFHQPGVRLSARQHIENTESRNFYSVIFFGFVDGKHLSQVAALFRRLFVDSQYARA